VFRSPLHYRAFRQRFGLERLSRAALPETITTRRAIDGHAPGDGALFYEYSRSRGTCMQGSARALSDGANRGQILVLDMGEPVNILNFAERLTRLAGLQPYKDIPIEFIGLRPGEKLREELFDEAEGRLDSGVAGILAAKPNPIQLPILRSLVQSLERMCSQGDDEAVLRLLKENVPGYQPGLTSAPVRTLVQARKTELLMAQPALAEGTSA
jgi:hypothetical protein